MESLAQTVILILLFIVSLPLIALAISFFEHRIIPATVYAISAISSAAAIWLGISVKSPGGWVFAVVVLVVNAVAVWNVRRVNKI